MPDDVLTLGPVTFVDFSTPNIMSAGGRQMAAVHRLLGGARVIDVLGPDEAAISWRGHFFGDDAYKNALALDALRAAGQPLPLVFAGQFRTVLIADFIYSIRRLPVWVEYAISVTVYQNPGLGDLLGTAGLSSMDAQVSADLSAISSLIAYPSSL